MLGPPHGEVIELRGDEALCVFPSARNALRCALNLQASFQEVMAHDPFLPLRVGQGLDAGEAIPVKGGYRGGALNLAARLCSLAGAGEVLASDAVTHLAGKIEGVAYAERGHVQLKGFADPVMVMEVIENHGLSVPEAAAILDESEAQPQAQEFSLGGFLGALPTNTLVGRNQELGHILDATDAVVSGTGRLVMLAGEPGTGKTRLAQEVTLHLRNRGFLVAAGRCYEPEQMVSYYPFLDALAMIYAAAPSALRQIASHRWPYLGALLPDQIGVLEVAGGSGLDDEQRVLRAVTGFLEAAAEIAPLALLLDDLHWTDTSSVKLLLHLARHTRTSRLLLLGTYRDAEVGPQHALEGALRDLGREGLIERIAVRRLEEEGTSQLIAATIGEDAISEEFVGLVHGRTEGNPFFVQQVLQVLVERGDLFRTDGVWNRRRIEAIEVPESIRSVIGQRLMRLSEAAQELLREASVLGQTIHFDDLLGMTGRSEKELERALEEARAAALVNEVGRDAYAFDHALTQQTLYEELSSRRRRKLHLAAGEAIEQLPGRKREQRVAELAWHFQEGGNPQRGLQYTLLVGQQAEAVFAHSEAEAHYRTALELARALDDTVGAAGAQEKLGHVLSMMARCDEALEVLEEAAAAYQVQGDSEGEARVVAQIGEVHFLRGTPEDGLARLQPLLHTVEGLQSPVLPRLYSALATLFFGMGKYREQAAAAERAAELARVGGDERTVALVEGRLGYALLLARRLNEAVNLYQRIIPQYEVAEDLPNLCSALTAAGDVHGALGDLLAVDHYLARALTTAERMGDPLPIAGVLQALGWNALITGAWEQAYRYSTQAEAILRPQTIPRLSAALLTLQGTIRLYQGDWEEASRLLEEAAATAERGQDERAGRGAQHKLVIRDLMAGQAEAALSRLHLVFDEKDLWNDAARNHLAELAEAHLELGNHARAEEIAVEALERYRAERDQFALVEMLRVYGMVLARQQRWEEAETAWGQIAALAQRMPYPFAHGCLLYERGMAQIQRGDCEGARERLEEALALFQRLGARRGVKRTEQALATLRQG
ncbi:MAG: AAA family ATPase [Chloroflexota bacterium]